MDASNLDSYFNILGGNGLKCALLHPAPTRAGRERRATCEANAQAEFDAKLALKNAKVEKTKEGSDLNELIGGLLNTGANGGNSGGGLSTGAWVGIAVGVLAVTGLVIFLVTRKK